MAQCACDYPNTKYNTWTEHSPLCPVEKEARDNPEQRFREYTGPPEGLPKKLQKMLKR